MTEAELKALTDTIGAQNKAQIEKLMGESEARLKSLVDTAKAQGGGVTEEQYKAMETANKEANEAIKEILRKQGVSIEELAAKMTTATPNKSIAQVLYEHKEQLDQVRGRQNGTMEFMVTPKADGTFHMTPLTNKVTGVIGTVAGIDTNVPSSILQSLNAQSISRLGANAPIFSQYRNNQWLFDLVNVIQADYVPGSPTAVWFEEVPKTGSSAVVAEGQLKPLVQYAYELKSAAYKKVAQLVNITEEFAIDFPRLESDIMGKGRTDVLNDINAAILVDLTSAATAYNTGTSFQNGTPVPNVNDFDAIAAMAAQVDSATFGNNVANAAIMSAFKKYRMGITKSTQGEYLNRPDVLDNISFVGNPGMGVDNVIVGDLKQFNVLLRGGFIVKVGYNGDDFARNRFSVVMEQYYYSYISAIRTPAIVKGPTFAAVKQAIGPVA